MKTLKYIGITMHCFIAVFAIVFGMCSMESSMLAGFIMLIVGLAMWVAHEGTGSSKFMTEYESEHELAYKLFGGELDE